MRVGVDKIYFIHITNYITNRICDIIRAMENVKITVGHLYPKQLNLYGDMGNIITLRNRCKWRGIDFEYIEINAGDRIPICDMYFIGGGQDKEQVEVSKYLYEQKDFLTEQRDNWAVFLGICGGYQLFGHYYQPFEGERLNGISLLDAYTVAGKKRFIGNVTARTGFLRPSTLVGFENHSGLTYIKGDTKPLAILTVGNGNNGFDNTEGAKFMNVFGTYLHGSLLPKNPHFADFLITLALEKRYEDEIELAPLDDKLEYIAHRAVVGKDY